MINDSNYYYYFFILYHDKTLYILEEELEFPCH